MDDHQSHRASRAKDVVVLFIKFTPGSDPEDTGTEIQDAN